MTGRLRLTACAALAALAFCVPVAAGAGAGPVPAPSIATEAAVRVLSPQAYLAAVMRDIAPLEAFGNRLGRISSARQAVAQAPALRRDLNRFAAGLTHLAGFRVNAAVLDAQRRRIVVAGRAALTPLGRFTSAISRGDKRAADALRPTVQRAMDRFGSAAQV